MIPPIIHYIWIQGEEKLPPQYAQWVEEARAKNPGFTVRVWDDEAIRADILTTYPELADPYLKYSVAYAQLADIARYAIIH